MFRKSKFRKCQKYQEKIPMNLQDCEDANEAGILAMLDETINTYHGWHLDGCSHATNFNFYLKTPRFSCSSSRIIELKVALIPKNLVQIVSQETRLSIKLLEQWVTSKITTFVKKNGNNFERIQFDSVFGSLDFDHENLEMKILLPHWTFLFS